MTREESDTAIAAGAAARLSAEPVPTVRMPAPPSQHVVALMIWIAVTPTLLAINLLLGPLMAEIPVIPRTVITVTIAVPIVIYGIMPLLHKLRRRWVKTRSS
jgi:antibiotic biosynthesis monooxygenase (ABM) superfamily enzyme